MEVLNMPTMVDSLAEAEVRKASDIPLSVRDQESRGPRVTSFAMEHGGTHI